MVLDQYLQLFAQYDDGLLTEQPPGFDYGTATGLFALFAADVLLAYSDIAVRVHPRLQDRSYHGEIAVPLSLNRDWLHIRVSNFGNLATLYLQAHEPMQHTPWQVETPDKREPEGEDVQRVAVAFEKCGYRHIPVRALLLPYERADERHWWVKTWMNRYFGLIA